MLSNYDSSLFAFLLHKSVIDPYALLKICHKNCMYQTKSREPDEKKFHEVSTQHYNSLIRSSIDQETQISQTNESKTTQTFYIHAPCSNRNHSSITSNKRVESNFTIVDPYAIVDRAKQGEQFLKFLYKQNRTLDSIYSNYLKYLQNYADNFLPALQQEHSVYGTYRQDLIRYMILLQEHINDLQRKLIHLQEANKNFALFQKYFHKTIDCKAELEKFLVKYDKRSKKQFSRNESVRGQQRFLAIYEKSYAQLRTVEQQRLLVIREQMRFAISLTLLPINNHHLLFALNNFDDLLNNWNNEHIFSTDRLFNSSCRPIALQRDKSLILHNEIKQLVQEHYSHQQTISNNQNLTLSRISDQSNTLDNRSGEFIKRENSTTSNITDTKI